MRHSLTTRTLVAPLPSCCPILWQPKYHTLKQYCKVPLLWRHRYLASSKCQGLEWAKEIWGLKLSTCLTARVCIHRTDKHDRQLTTAGKCRTRLWELMPLCTHEEVQVLLKRHTDNATEVQIVPKYWSWEKVAQDSHWDKPTVEEKH